MKRFFAGVLCQLSGEIKDASGISAPSSDKVEVSPVSNTDELNETECLLLLCVKM